MPAWKLLFPSDYLCADDLLGKDVTVAIESVGIETLKRQDGEERKPVVRFKGKKKRMVLTKTNAKSIAKVTGKKDTDDWAGAEITLYGREERHFGETMLCLRVREGGRR